LVYFKAIVYDPFMSHQEQLEQKNESSSLHNPVSDVPQSILGEGDSLDDRPV
jgi:hypothetical protein